MWCWAVAPRQRVGGCPLAMLRAVNRPYASPAAPATRHRAWALLAVVAFMLYLTRFQIIPEERALAQRFGESFDRYCQRVRRWL